MLHTDAIGWKSKYMEKVDFWGMSIDARCVQFFEYWNSLPKEGHVPYRREFDPIEISTLLPHSMICEVASDDNIRIRLIGESVDVAYGRGLKGINILDLFASEHLDAGRYNLLTICSFPVGFMGRIRARSNASGRVMYRELINLPMRDDDGSCRLIYGCSVETENQDAIPLAPQSSKVHAVVSQKFIDIGAGLPDAKIA